MSPDYLSCRVRLQADLNVRLQADLNVRLTKAGRYSCYHCGMGAMVNVNGVVTGAAQAVIPVYDHGFLYGEGVYEVFRTWNGVPFEKIAW